MTRAAILLYLAASGLAGQDRPPVVLLNGYQASCGSRTDSTAVFGRMQSLLEAQGLTVYYFNNCSVNGSGSARPSIEELGQALEGFLDTMPSPQVDVIAHSMGGLIVRSYIEGLLPGGTVAPPAVNRIRKAVLIGTPNNGALALAYFFLTSPVDAQLEELLPGSEFEWTLNTVNQRSFDFRGTEALAIVGNSAGTTEAPNTNDGVVPLTSASIARFTGPEYVRVLPGCHMADMPRGLCDGPGLAFVDSPSHLTFVAIDSFLKGTAAWQSVGHSASADPVLSRNGGIDVVAADNNGLRTLSIAGIAARQGELPGNRASGVFFGDLLAIGDYQFSIVSSASGVPARFSFTPTPGFHVPVVVKNGPRIDAIASATGPLPGLSRAPGMMVAVYGSGLSATNVTVGGQTATVLYSSDTQVNAVLPSGISGVTPFTVQSPVGSDSTELFVEPAVPGLFTTDAKGSALAVHADGAPVDASRPATRGELLSLYATGLDNVSTLQIAVDETMMVQGDALKLTEGLNLVVFRVPEAATGLVSLTAGVGFRQSNRVTLEVQ